MPFKAFPFTATINIHCPPITYSSLYIDRPTMQCLQWPTTAVPSHPIPISLHRDQSTPCQPHPSTSLVPLLPLPFLNRTKHFLAVSLTTRCPLISSLSSPNTRSSSISSVILGRPHHNHLFTFSFVRLQRRSIHQTPSSLSVPNKNTRKHCPASASPSLSLMSTYLLLTQSLHTHTYCN